MAVVWETSARSEGPSVSLNGLVVVDKEAGWTSHDVVARCRRLFGQRRVGHAGTLDPDATGVLLVGLGRATRLLRFLTALPKTYTTDIVLGTATSTLDASGEVVGTYDIGHVTPELVRAAAEALTGEIEQVPPMVSAVKVGGRRLHDLARQGIEVERPARSVTVYRFDTAPDRARAGRVPGRGGVLVGDLRPRARPRPREGARRRGARGQPPAHPHRLVRRGRNAPARPHRPRRSPHAGRGHARSRRGGGRSPDRGLDPYRTSPRQGAARGGGRRALGHARRGGNLLAVYEATGTDRIRPAVVLAGE